MGNQYDENLQCYLKHSLLTQKQEIELARRAQSGDKQALHQLVEANMRLVIRIAQRYAHSNGELIDLVHEGALGLLRAAEKFDPRRGARFSTFATSWVRKAIGDACPQQTSAPMGIYHFRQYNQIRTARRLFREQGLEPTFEELAEAAGLKEERVRGLLSALEPISLDAPLNPEEDFTLADTLEDTSVSATSEEVAPARLEKLRQALDCLEPREREVLEMYYGRTSWTLKEIASEVGYSDEWVRKLWARALAKLRQVLL